VTKFYDPVTRSVASEIVCSKLAEYLSVMFKPARTLVFLPEVLIRKKIELQLVLKNFPTIHNKTEYLSIKFNDHLPCKNTCFSV